MTVQITEEKKGFMKEPFNEITHQIIMKVLNNNFPCLIV